MKSKIFPLVLIGLSILIPMVMIFGVYHVKAKEVLSVEDREACGICHYVIDDAWQVSEHGLATADEVFLAAWDTEDKSCLTCHTTGYDSTTDTWEMNGVYCTNCHDPNQGEHPDNVMPTDFSSNNCGSCHLETFSDWQESTHSEVTLNCNNCHNPHTTTLKVDNAQALCQACHQDETHSFDITVHSEQGLLCIDCHLGVERVSAGEGHSKRTHTFVVEAGTCVECHEENFHAAGLGPIDPIDPKNPTVFNAEALIQNEPEPVGPFGFALLATLVGLGAGIVLAPWLAPRLRRELQS